MGAHSNRTKVLDKIISLYKNKVRTPEELATLLNMNYNTVRSKYVYYLLEKISSKDLEENILQNKSYTCCTIKKNIVFTQ